VQQELRDWALRELNGYGPDDELPPWRIVTAPLKIDFSNVRGIVRGYDISPWELPEFARDKITNDIPFAKGVGELGEILRGTEDFIKLSPPGAQDLVMLWNHDNRDEFQHIHVLYWVVSKIAISSILDRIRTTLTAIVAELRAGMGDGGGLPSPELTKQAVEIAVHGHGNRVIINQSGAGEPVVGSTVGGSSEGGRARWKFWGTIGAFVVGLATVIGVIVQRATG